MSPVVSNVSKLYNDKKICKNNLNDRGKINAFGLHFSNFFKS